MKHCKKGTDLFVTLIYLLAPAACNIIQPSNSQSELSKQTQNNTTQEALDSHNGFGAEGKPSENSSGTRILISYFT